MEKKCGCATEGKCIICGAEVARDEVPSSFGERFCSEEHLNEYMKSMWGLQRKHIWGKR
jgi:hypothetical protein